MRGTSVIRLVVPAVLGALLAGAASGLPDGRAASKPPPLPPLLYAEDPAATRGEYIFVFKDTDGEQNVAAAVKRVKMLHGTVRHAYSSIFHGFDAANVTPSALAALRASPGVAFVEASRPMHWAGPWQAIPCTGACKTQTGPPTGLDRTDQRLPGLDGFYHYTEDGTGVNAYVVDSGVDVSHPQFQGRAVWDTSAVNGTYDCVGHGTHVAGIIGSKDYGVAKNVTIHSVQVGECAALQPGDILTGIEWVRDYAVQPAVMNISIGGPADSAIETALQQVHDNGITVVGAAGNDDDGSCQGFLADVADVILVGATDPASPTDARWVGSNWGPCVDLFAPGENIESTVPGATAVHSGTSMAAPHVTGVAALILQKYPSSTPQQVQDAIDLAADVYTVVPPANVWAGVGDPGAGSVNELLHWGAYDDGLTDGDPHLHTVSGHSYDFQPVGEFTLLRDPGSGLEIQTRQTPWPATGPVHDTHTGLAACPSVDTAVSARVGADSVSYQPAVPGSPDPATMQLYVDGSLTALPAQGLSLGARGRVMPHPSATGAIEIDFPDGTVMLATPRHPQSWNRWYLSVQVLHTGAGAGLLGVVSPGRWLPAAPDGSEFPARSGDPHANFVELNRTFADAWRVTDATSLFHYAPGTSTATFTDRELPAESGDCNPVDVQLPPPVPHAVAVTGCAGVTIAGLGDDCVADVETMRDPTVASGYLASQRVVRGATAVRLSGERSVPLGSTSSFSARVDRLSAGGPDVPSGSVQFGVDGAGAGRPVKLDAHGEARWTGSLGAGAHTITAAFTPSGGVFLPSTSLPVTQSVRSVTLTPSGHRRPDGAFDGPVTVALVESDGSRVRPMQLSVDGGDWTAYAGPVRIAVPGSHTVRASELGTGLAHAQSIAFTIDASGLVSTATLTPAERNGWFASPTMTLTASDGPGAGVAHVEYALDGGPWTTYAEPIVGFATGRHVLRHRAVSASGLVGSVRTLAFRVDASSPVVRLKTPSDGQVVKAGSMVKVAFSCSDSGSGMDSCVGTLPNGESLPTATVGARTFTVTATDRAGNRTVVTHAYSVVTRGAASSPR